jgi:hypothetical protein
MEMEKIDSLRDIVENMEQLILSFSAYSDEEWDALEKLVAAHHFVRRIDFDALTQLDLLGNE